MSILALVGILIVWAAFSIAEKPSKRPHTQEELERMGAMFCGKSAKECRKILRKNFK